ncbi:MAG: MoaD/ThiS family protein [Acidimicrobiales bacterium]
MATLRLFASAREAAGVAKIEIEAATIGGLLDEAGQRFGPDFRRILDASRVWLNGQPTGPDTQVTGLDVVAVLPPVSGGSALAGAPTQARPERAAAPTQARPERPAASTPTQARPERPAASTPSQARPERPAAPTQARPERPAASTPSHLGTSAGAGTARSGSDRRSADNRTVPEPTPVRADREFDVRSSGSGWADIEWDPTGANTFSAEFPAVDASSRTTNLNLDDSAAPAPMHRLTRPTGPRPPLPGGTAVPRSPDRPVLSTSGPVRMLFAPNTDASAGSATGSRTPEPEGGPDRTAPDRTAPDRIAADRTAPARIAAARREPSSAENWLGTPMAEATSLALSENGRRNDSRAEVRGIEVGSPGSGGPSERDPESGHHSDRGDETGDDKQADPMSGDPPDRASSGRAPAVGPTTATGVTGWSQGWLGLGWAVLSLAAVAAGPRWLAFWLVAQAAAAAAQLAAAGRFGGMRLLVLGAALVAGVQPLAALGGPGQLLAAMGAAAVAVALGRFAGTNPAQTAVFVRVLAGATIIGAAMGALVLIAESQMSVALFLLACTCAYDVGAYLVGTGAASRWEGPVAGMAAIVPVALFGLFAGSLATFLDSSSIVKLAVATAVLAPLGGILARTLRGRDLAEWRTPTLRRIDSLIVTVPVWYLGVDVFG